MASFFPSVPSSPNCQLNTDGTLKLQVVIKFYCQAEVQMHLSSITVSTLSFKSKQMKN